MATDQTNRVAYSPLNTLKPVADGIWIVDGGPMHVAMIPIPIRMTVVRLASGQVWLHSPVPYNARLRSEIEALGPISHLVAPNIAHWSFVKDWQRQFPEATTWAAPGLRKRRQVKASGVRFDRDLGHVPPEEWAGDLQQRLLEGGLGLAEAVFLHRASRTLILTDLVENFEAEKLSPALRPLVRAAGAMEPQGMAPPHYRLATNLRRSQAKALAQELVDWGPERVIFAHGKWFDRDGTAQLRRSLRWLLG
ncbi:DUF4336 domain-containing protein [Rubellimicrobium rubrum]|uniref:DUF4336 domain-containing protein n=1 Tax=Rubellimicrobium rubrum TaxID=2585369 RepID=A0A5C4N5S0_9RHOB|nr:DUF4336 domain-containing protein [Rubellimicrobium rubrum]TNC52304.1 DUF4336 domain-containing protein [Rubellimicrobium rubrum]